MANANISSYPKSCVRGEHFVGSTKWLRCCRLVLKADPSLTSGASGVITNLLHRTPEF